MKQRNISNNTAKETNPKADLPKTKNEQAGTWGKKDQTE